MEIFKSHVDLFKVMRCEYSFRSKQGKTVILRVFEDGRVEITGDFFTTEEDLRRIEEALSKREKLDAQPFILGVDIDELYEALNQCLK
jgi:hypothetical protein